MESASNSNRSGEEVSKYFKALAAMAENRVIGQGGRIPWYLPEDFRWFKRTTMGHVLVMGRRTFESIGRPLPGRETIVLSRSGFAYPGVRTVPRLEDIEWEGENRELFICGGAEVYRQALPFCSDLFLTRVRRVAEGDVVFPPFEDRFEFLDTLLETPEFRVEHHRNRCPQRMSRE
jgi:dihydrofolate reductase